MTTRNHIPRIAFNFMTKKHIRILENVFRFVFNMAKIYGSIFCVCVWELERDFAYRLLL